MKTTYLNYYILTTIYDTPLNSELHNFENTLFKKYLAIFSNLTLFLALLGYFWRF